MILCLIDFGIVSTTISIQYNYNKNASYNLTDTVETNTTQGRLKPLLNEGADLMSLQYHNM